MNIREAVALVKGQPPPSPNGSNMTDRRIEELFESLRAEKRQAELAQKRYRFKVGVAALLLSVLLVWLLLH